MTLSNFNLLQGVCDDRPAYLGVGIDACDEGLENQHLIMTLRQHKAEECPDQVWLRDPSQKQVQVGCGCHHLITGILKETPIQWSQ